MKLHNVLCGCGWGLIGCPENEIPQLCPVCGFDLWAHADGHREEEEDEEENGPISRHVFKGNSVVDDCSLCGWHFAYKIHC